MIIRRMTDGTYFYCKRNKIIRKAYDQDFLFEILELLRRKVEKQGVLNE